MSAPERGRHKAGRHAAPKPPRTLPKSVGAVATVASFGSAAFTGASTIAASHTTSEHPKILADPATPKITITPAPIRKSITSRAAAASRSDNRTTVVEATAINNAADATDPLSDPNGPIDTTPTVTTTERRTLQSLAGTTDQLDSVVAQAQQQAADQAAQLVEQQKLAQEIEQKNQQDAAAALIAAAQAKLAGIRQAPIEANYHLTARFGQRGSLWSRGWHTGLDFQVSVGTSVYAAESGTVISAGWAGAYGYRIEVQHADGYVTAYNHLSKIEVDKGGVVVGQELAKSGATGNVTGPHLHFEVTKDGALINPSNWLWGELR